MKARFLSAVAISAMATTAWAHHSYGMFYEIDKGSAHEGTGRDDFFRRAACQADH